MLIFKKIILLGGILLTICSMQSVVPFHAEIVYGRNNELCLLNVATGDSLCIATDGTVWSPLFDNHGKSIYFQCNKKINKNGNYLVNIRICKYEFDSKVITQLDSLILDDSCFEPPNDVILTMNKSHELILWIYDDMETTTYKLEPSSNILVFSEYDENITESDTSWRYEMEFDGMKIYNQKVGNIYELFLQKQDGTNTRITHTTKCRRQPETMGEKIVFGISPNMKSLAFLVSTSMGDFYHGPMFSVNLRGKHQALLLEDGYSREIGWLHNGTFLYLDDFKNLHSCNANGNKRIIRKHVDCFAGRRD